MTPAQSAIIARLEAATGPDRELIRDIAFAIGWRVCWGKWYSPATAAEARKSKKALPAYPASLEPPDFIGSLDAAMMLVPEGYWWGLHMLGSKDGGFSAAVLPEDTHMEWHRGATAHLALCIAALEARWSNERNAT